MIHKVKGLITTILIIYLAYIISTLVWQIFAKEDKVIPTNNTIKSSSNNIPQNLFGVEKKIVKQPTYTKVKKTKLDVELIGVISRKVNPIAIIKLASGLNRVHKIGDKINGIAEIKDIQDHFIIINYNSKDEKLVIERKTDKKISNKLEKIVKEEVVATKNIDISTKNKQKIKKYLQQAKTNPKQLLNVIQVEPNFISGLLSGFKLSPGKERNLFSEIGFEKGDIVIEINQIKLDSMSNAFKIGKDLAKQNEFSFIIMRDGVEQHLNFNLN